MWQILITSLSAGLISQLSKPLIKSNKIKFDWPSLTAYAGTPSSHAAFVVSLTVIVGLTQNFNSPLFAVCFIFSLLIIRDAMGIRRYLGEHNEITNQLITELKDESRLKAAYPKLPEKIGHTPAQIIAGAILGCVISLISYYIF